MPTVDVIIPAYNASAFLSRALKSVEAQSFSDWRMVVVDDGSTDDTPAIAAGFAEKLGGRFRYIRQENAGLPAARNTAIRHSDAPFLALLDADDVWLPNRLQDTLARFAGHPEIGLVYGFIQRIDAQDRVLDSFATRHPHAEGHVARYIYMRMLDLPCPTLTFRRECVERVGMFDETMRATEDRDLWLRIAQQYQVGLAPSIVAYYRVSPQAMTTDTDRMLRAQMQFLDKHYGEPGCGWMERRVALSWIFRQRAETLADQRKYGRALASALRAVGYWPFAGPSLRALASVTLRAVGLRRGNPIDPTR